MMRPRDIVPAGQWEADSICVRIGRRAESLPRLRFTLVVNMLRYKGLSSMQTDAPYLFAVCVGELSTPRVS